MRKLLDILTEQFENVMEECGYDKKFAKITVSNRPDLCEYQCNGAMALAKAHKKAPIMIANELVEKLAGNEMFKEIVAVNPGFINIKISDSFIANYVDDMAKAENVGCEKNINTYRAYEIDPYAIKTTQHNFPDTIQCGDAFKVRDIDWQA